MKDGLGLFGAPLSHMEMRWVHGKFYRRLVPVVGGSKDLPPPPDAGALAGGPAAPRAPA